MLTIMVNVSSKTTISTLECLRHNYSMNFLEIFMNAIKKIEKLDV